MKKIIISEKKEQFLFEYFINENAVFTGDKKELVKNFLTTYFKPADSEKENDFGVFTTDSKDKLVVKLDSLKQPTEKTMTLEQLHQLLQYRYQNILSDKKERDSLLWEIILEWYK